ncbi:sulfite exporter TauE/SafE family protein [soil metagenome]
MNSALFASALMIGLAGGPHCVVMCGAGYAGITRGKAKVMLSLQLGRLVGYSLAGALVAGSVSGLASLGDAAPLMRPLWTLLHVAAVALGLYMLWSGSVPGWLAELGRRGVVPGGAAPALVPADALVPANAPASWPANVAARADGSVPLRFFPRMAPSARAAGIGLCWAAMPCGLLQSALIVAALASGPVQGAGVMAGFALASGVSLWLGPSLWVRLGRLAGPVAASTLPMRLAGGLLAAGSVFAIVHGLMPIIDRVLCLPSAT